MPGDVEQTLRRAEGVLERYGGSREAISAQARRVERAAGELGRRAVRSAAAMSASGVGIAGYGLAVGGLGVELLIAAALAVPAIGVGALLIPTRKALPPARLKEAPVARLAPEAEDWLVKRRSLLPKAAGRSVDLVANALHGIAPALARLPDNSAEAAEARRLIGEHLPRLVDAWLAIPPAHRTAETEAEVSRALGVVGEAVSDLSARLAAGSLDALKVEGRFLESRYSEKGPQSR